MSVETALPLVILSCRVMEDLIKGRDDDAQDVIYMDYGLHVRPKLMAPALQERLDQLEVPSLVLIGYGSCGHGTVGLNAGKHTLIIPKMADCIAMLMGSHKDYMDEFQENAGTYYLTKGWLESFSDPLGEYERLLERYDQRRADKVMNAMYSHYSELCLIGHTQEDIDAQMGRAKEVAEFCKNRWNMSFKTKVGKSDFIDQLLLAPKRLGALGDDFILLSPGETLTAEMFDH